MDGIPVELFQILKGDAVRVLHSICQQIWKTHEWPQDWKGQFSFKSQRKAMSKNVHITAQLHLSHMLAKSCSKFSKPGFKSMWTMNFQMYNLDLEKAEEPEIKLSSSVGSLKNQQSSRKTFTSTLLTTWKPLCGSSQTVENSKRDGNPRLSYLLPEKSVCRSRSTS